MKQKSKIICVGCAGWDFIGRTQIPMGNGSDVPGTIKIKIGGVATNIARNLTKNKAPNTDLDVILLSCIGNDPGSEILLEQLENENVNCRHILRAEGLSDSYIGIEAKGELFGAVASSNLINSHGTDIIKQFEQRSISKNENLLYSHIILDTNLSYETLNYIVKDSFLSGTDIVIACASPYKTDKLRYLLETKKCSIYSNLKEASAIAKKNFLCSSEAAEYLYTIGAHRATVTNGANKASNRCDSGLATITPRHVLTKTATGAGDAFLAAHILSMTFNPNDQAIRHLEIAELAARKKIRGKND